MLRNSPKLSDMEVSMFGKINSRRKTNEAQYVLMWHKGGYISGTDWSIARKYCKVKRLIMGLVKIEGRAQMVYSFKLNGRWSPHGSIDDTGDYESNRRAAFRDFFHKTLTRLQDDFSIIALKH